MKTPLILLMFLILLFLGIRQYIIYCINFCAKEDEFYHDVLSLIRKEEIPIMRNIVSLGMLHTEFRNKVMPKENQKIYSDIYNSNFCGFRQLFNVITPELFYNTFKKELCGNLPTKWKKALKEANTLRLENLNK